MQPKEKQAIERFCQDVVAWDPWNWRETCTEILREADYDREADYQEISQEYYVVAFYLKSGREISLSRKYGGWSVDYGSKILKEKIRERSTAPHL